MEEMKWKDTESTTERVVERMETSMCSMEQMSFDAINITDSLVTLTSKARVCCHDEEWGCQRTRGIVRADRQDS